MSEVKVSNPHRLRFIDSMQHWAPLDAVVSAVVDAASDQPRVYVERLGDLYRWSIVSGSGYPLHRTVAAYLGVDYTRIYIGFRTVQDGVCIVCEDPSNFDAPDSWAVIDLDPSIDDAQVEALVTSRLA